MAAASCAKCGQEEPKDGFWVACDNCDSWKHGTCVGLESPDVGVWACSSACKEALWNPLSTRGVLGLTIQNALSIVVGMLSYKDVVAMQQVCKQWRNDLTSETASTLVHRAHYRRRYASKRPYALNDDEGGLSLIRTELVYRPCGYCTTADNKAPCTCVVCADPEYSSWNLLCRDRCIVNALSSPVARAEIQYRSNGEAYFEPLFLMPKVKPAAGGPRKKKPKIQNGDTMLRSLLSRGFKERVGGNFDSIVSTINREFKDKLAQDPPPNQRQRIENDEKAIKHLFSEFRRLKALGIFRSLHGVSMTPDVFDFTWLCLCGQTSDTGALLGVFAQICL